jgi:hypothetical protein
MLKDFKTLRSTSNIIKEASGSVVSDLLRMHPEIDGREEEFTSQLKSEITLHLMERIRSQLDGRVIHGIRFDVYVFKKSEENKVGADLLGLLEIEIGGEKITKAYLAQAKVGSAYALGEGEVHARCYDARLQKQVKDMLNLTSDFYVFIYTNQDVFVVPALEVKLSGSNSISTQDFYYRRFGTFYEEFFKCFIGDHKIVPPHIEPSELANLVSPSRGAKWASN